MRGDVLVERHLIGAMPPAPEAMAVARLVHRDAIDPGAQARLSAEAVDGAEDAEEDVLGQVERLVAIAEQVDRELHHHALVLGDQIGARRLVAGRAALHERRFAAANVQPADDARVFHRESPRVWRHEAGNSTHYICFRP